jgi:hypothetical protein
VTPEAEPRASSGRTFDAERAPDIRAKTVRSHEPAPTQLAIHDHAVGALLVRGETHLMKPNSKAGRSLSHRAVQDGATNRETQALGEAAYGIEVGIDRIGEAHPGEGESERVDAERRERLDTPGHDPFPTCLVDHSWMMIEHGDAKARP